MNAPGDQPTLLSPAEKELSAWQRRLMPWLVILPTVLAALFILLATIRLQKFERFTFDEQRSVFDTSLPSPSDSSGIGTKSERYLKLYILTKMEEHSLNKRYSQAGVITMSTIYTKYLGFFTGMILAIVGSAFVISKLKEDVSQIEGSYSETAKLKLLSSSPGVVFAVLGTVLMSISIINKGEVKVDDVPLYLNSPNLYMINEGSDSSAAHFFRANLPAGIPQAEADSADPTK
jgi:hypothetical protein